MIPSLSPRLLCPSFYSLILTPREPPFIQWIFRQIPNMHAKVKGVNRQMCIWVRVMGVWQGVAIEALQFHLVPLMPLKWPSGCFRGGLPTGWVARSQLLLLWTPHAVRQWLEWTVRRGDVGMSLKWGNDTLPVTA
jgi:hypothetical protein